MGFAGVGRPQTNTGSGVVTDHRVPDKEIGITGSALVGDALLSHACDHGVLDGNRFRGNDPDADGAGSDGLVDALDLDASKDDAVVSAGGVDGNAGAARNQDRTEGLDAVEGDRLDQGHAAET